ncbi:MAG: radical SAM protein [bacterium]|nr:radical SAM protein [bacterium]
MFKVLFVYPNFRSESLIPPGITLLSRILKNQGFKVDLFDTTDYGLDLSRDSDKISEHFLVVRPSEHRELMRTGRDIWKDLNDKINSFQPDLIAMSSTESTFLLGIEVLKHIERHDHREMPVILGGVFATFTPERALSFPEIDIVCVGEGEVPLPELCHKMERGEDWHDVPGLAYRDRFGMVRKNQPPKLVNLDENPVDFDLGLFDPERLIRPMAGKLYSMAPVETMRGCPYRCTFCNSPGQNTMFDMPDRKFVRKKSMVRVREELLYYRDVHSVEYNFFWADTFLAMSKRELDEFCEIYKDIGLPFWVQTRVETITDWRLKKLKDVGLHRIAFGIENGDEHFRQQILAKEFSNDEAVRALEVTADMGVTFSTNNMVGYPHETREIAMETVRLNRRFPLADTTSCSIFTPYYGTVARDMAVKAGFMDPDAIAPSNAEESILDMPQFLPSEVRKFRRVFALYVKFPEERWPEIERAEAETPEGDALLHTLQAEYRQTFFGEPESAY